MTSDPIEGMSDQFINLAAFADSTVLLTEGQRIDLIRILIDATPADGRRRIASWVTDEYGPFADLRRAVAELGTAARGMRPPPDKQREPGDETTLAVHDDGSRTTLRHHGSSTCQLPCPFHGPSNHPLKDSAMHWRADRGILERICQHGVGHPDPDSLAFHSDDSGIHGCCIERCCAAPPDPTGTAP
jgi:hypothetical protein